MVFCDTNHVKSKLMFESMWKDVDASVEALVTEVTLFIRRHCFELQPRQIHLWSMASFFSSRAYASKG